MRNRIGRPTRSGFTLVELLVSAALIIFVMLIITSVFTSGLTALRNLRGVGQLQDQLRYANTLMRRDLSSPHFGAEMNSYSGPYLSQQRIDTFDWKPPRQGFMRVWQGTTSMAEAQDSDGIRSMLMNPTGVPYLHFAVRSDAEDGTGRDESCSTASLGKLIAALVNSGNPTDASRGAQLQSQLQQYVNPPHLSGEFPTTYYSRWAEVTYFVRPVMNGAQQATIGTPPRDMGLYTLYRRRRVLIDAPPSAPALPPIRASEAALLTDVSLYDPNPTGPADRAVYFNTPADVAAPIRRFGMMPVTQPTDAAVAGVGNPGLNPPYSFPTLFETNPTSAGQGGDDVLLENVLSFEVRATWESPMANSATVPPDPRFDPRMSLRMPPLPAYAPPYWPTAFGVGNSDYPFDNLPRTDPQYGNQAMFTLAGLKNLRVFDTWTDRDAVVTIDRVPSASTPSTFTVPYSRWNERFMKGPASGGGNATLQAIDGNVAIPLRVRLRGVQIRLRIWDARTEQARQITIVQDL